MQQPELAPLAYARWLSAKEVGAELGVTAQTVRRWIHLGLPTGHEIPARYLNRRGFGEHLLHPAVLDFIRAEQLEFLEGGPNCRKPQ